MIKKWQKICRGMSLAVVVALYAMPCFASAKEKNCEVILPVRIETTGDSVSTKEMFEVSIASAEPDTPMPKVTTQTIEGDGEISFGPINYTLPEDYHYVITQKKGNASHWSYDQKAYEVTVRIVNNEEDELVSEVWAIKSGSDEKSDKIKFINHYEEPSVPTVPTSKPKTGDLSDIRLYVGMMGGSLLIMLVVLWRGLRHFKHMK